MEPFSVRIDEIYIPVKRRQSVNPDSIGAIAESILEIGLKTPISVRQDSERYVLVNGLQRLEACKALGEETITAILVGARRY